MGAHDITFLTSVRTSFGCWALALRHSLWERIPMERNGDQFVRSLARGLAVIRCFGSNAEALTLTEISKRSDLCRAAARRILLTLQHLGYVRTDGRRFSLTPRILDLGYSYVSSLPFWEFAQPVMERVASKVQESCSIAVLDGNDTVYVMHLPTSRISTTNFRVGGRLPAYPQSMGRILLGGLSNEELDRYFASVELRSLTRRTVVDPVRLKKIIAEDKRKGWSWVDGELEEGMCGIAVPLMDAENKMIAAIHIVSNRARCSKSLAVKTFLPELKSAVKQIDSALMMRRT